MGFSFPLVTSWQGVFYSHFPTNVDFYAEFHPLFTVPTENIFTQTDTIQYCQRLHDAKINEKIFGAYLQM